MCSGIRTKLWGIWYICAGFHTKIPVSGPVCLPERLSFAVPRRQGYPWECQT